MTMTNYKTESLENRLVFYSHSLCKEVKKAVKWHFYDN